MARTAASHGRTVVLACALLLACAWGGGQQLGLWSDGCSLSPDIGGQACHEHDLSYHIGGTREDRAIADHELALALYSHGHRVETVERYFWAVRKYGASHFNDREESQRSLPADYPHGCFTRDR